MILKINLLLIINIKHANILYIILNNLKNLIKKN